MDNSIVVVAGPCSMNKKNIEQIINILELGATGVRMIGIKSRTNLLQDNSEMGMDYLTYIRNIEILQSGGGINNLIKHPSIKYVEDVVQNFPGAIIATEIMDPLIQLGLIGRFMPNVNLMPWNPSTNSLGWPLYNMSQFCQKYNWNIGIKNPKAFQDSSDFIKTWQGLYSYTSDNQTYLIHRGVAVINNSGYRNLPVHEAAMETKLATGAKMLFDPSHSCGPKRRDFIIKESLIAMNMRMSTGNYLYDGLLIEVGDSKTDTEQHITLLEFKELLDKFNRPIAAKRDKIAIT